MHMNKKYIIPCVVTRDISLQCVIMQSPVGTPEVDSGATSTPGGNDLGAPARRLYI